MTGTPQPVKQVSIIKETEESKSIRFYGTTELAAFIRANGYGRLSYDETTSEYELVVSPLYSFEAVVDWMHEQEAA